MTEKMGSVPAGPGITFNKAAIEPLYLPHEEPNSHRVKSDIDGGPAKKVRGRRPSTIGVVQELRIAVSVWREADYPGVSDTTRTLLRHWFKRSHEIETPDGEVIPFTYYYCQREAIETLIYLLEVNRITSLANLMGTFGGTESELLAQGVNPEDDIWARYAFKIATGAGKTKVMSLVVAWSYFHALRESESLMARNFVVIAPNLTVFERLKEDFEGGKIFDRDPLIPEEWKGDWNLNVILQDEAGGASSGGTLYLTNIHRLYNPERKLTDADTYDWMGPKVQRAKALDTGKALRERITSHDRVLLMNDEAHHVWDPDSAWNEAIRSLHDDLVKRGGAGLVAQLDFSATPKDNKGQLFQHVIVEAPLGEAVDGGIVKTPVIGKGENLIEQASDDASERFSQHLQIGYARWKASREEWEKSGKFPLLFVMTEDTKAADEIARRLNTDPAFELLNGKALNLHTRLKGKIKKVGKGASAKMEFVENETEISDEDLKELRKLSRDLDKCSDEYRCIVSVLMLREGWDVRNVTTIVPLRPYSSKANILPEQTLGRGLRRMTPPGQAAEVVSVVEHKAFANLYRHELAQEGLPIEIVDVENIPKTTVTIYPDGKNKDLKKLHLELPSLSPGHKRAPILSPIGYEEIQQAFSRYKKLYLGSVQEEEINYEGKHLITQEVVERMNIHLPLLTNGVGAVTFHRIELEHLSGLTNTHKILAPLLERFFTETLFIEQATIFDPRLVSRLGDTDVREITRAVFLPILREKTTIKKERIPAGSAIDITKWPPFQVTHSERHPVIPANTTPFNLVPCNRSLERAVTEFLDHAPDVAAFCKNAGPQALRLDYMGAGKRLATYTPDFIVRLDVGQYLLIETKGREDLEVPLKAQAAVEWCKAATKEGHNFAYVYVPEGLFSDFHGNQAKQLASACEPALVNILSQTKTPQMTFAFEEAPSFDATKEVEFLSDEEFGKLPPRHRKGIEEAIALVRFYEKKPGSNLSPIFTALLGAVDSACEALIFKTMAGLVPVTAVDQRLFFESYYGNLPPKEIEYYRSKAVNLRRTLVYRKGLSPLGLLCFCLDYAQDDNVPELKGVFDAVKKGFAPFKDGGLYAAVKGMNDFRNQYVAHQEKELTDLETAKNGLRAWIRGLLALGKIENK
ncbi:MAG TPA: DEAD/DEAH box helicase family protein [Acidobacteriota bacterium]|nr:DEAD/DEAH box helicase family protein [Acidobacteriota bacterium]